MALKLQVDIKNMSSSKMSNLYQHLKDTNSLPKEIKTPILNEIEKCISKLSKTKAVKWWADYFYNALDSETSVSIEKALSKLKIPKTKENISFYYNYVFKTDL